MLRQKTARVRQEAPPPLDRDRPDVQRLLDTMGRAVTTGNGAAVAELWAVPTLILGDGMVKAVSDPKELESWFNGAPKEYHARGIADTRAEIQRLYRLTDKIIMVDVRWPYLDASGKEAGDERSTYTMRRSDDGALKIQAAVMRGQSKRT